MNKIVFIQKVRNGYLVENGGAVGPQDKAAHVYMTQALEDIAQRFGVTVNVTFVSGEESAALP